MSLSWGERRSIRRTLAPTGPAPALARGPSSGRFVPELGGVNRAPGAGHAHAGEHALAQRGGLDVGVNRLRAHAEERAELSGVLERVGDHTAVDQGDRRGSAAVDLADQDLAAERPLAVELGEAAQRVTVIVGGATDDVCVGGEHRVILSIGWERVPGKDRFWRPAFPYGSQASGGSDFRRIRVGEA